MRAEGHPRIGASGRKDEFRRWVGGAAGSGSGSTALRSARRSEGVGRRAGVTRGRCRSIWIAAVLVLGPWLGCRLPLAAPTPALGRLVIELPQAERGASGAVVYLESAADPLVQDTGRLIEIASEGPSFQAPPRVIQSGDRIRFVNQGGVAHRIFVTDEAGRRERQVSPRAHSAELPITRPGEHRFYCSLHPDESVLLFATPSPHFVIPNGETRHTIDGLVAGVYQVGWWSENGVRRLGTVEIQPGRSEARAVLLEPGLPALPRSDVTTP